MIPKVCILNFLVSPHVLDSYRPAQKMAALAKEFSQQGKPTEKAVHRYTPVNMETASSECNREDAVFCLYFNC